jgi:aspartate/methionine/tyrosine aminotransferase/chorismate mutase
MIQKCDIGLIDILFWFSDHTIIKSHKAKKYLIHEWLQMLLAYILLQARAITNKHINTITHVIAEMKTLISMRMHFVESIAHYKCMHEIPIEDWCLEDKKIEECKRYILSKLSSQVDDQIIENIVRKLFVESIHSIFAVSKNLQWNIMYPLTKPQVKNANPISQAMNSLYNLAIDCGHLSPLDKIIWTPSYHTNCSPVDNQKKWLQYKTYPLNIDLQKQQIATLLHHQHKYNTTISSKNICITNGSQDWIRLISKLLIEDNTIVILPDPAYPSFKKSITHHYDIQYYSYELWTWQEIENIMTAIDTAVKNRNDRRIRLRISSPNNPTWHTFSYDELVKIVYKAHTNNILILFDNAYRYIHYRGGNALSIFEVPYALNNCIELISSSKDCWAPGMRMWIIIAQEDVIDIIQWEQSATMTNLNTSAYEDFIQVMKITKPKRVQSHYKNFMKQTRKVLQSCPETRTLKIVYPDGAFYFRLEIPSDYEYAEEYCSMIAKKYWVLFLPWIVFGERWYRYIRICFSLDPSILASYLLTKKKIV